MDQFQSNWEKIKDNIRNEFEITDIAYNIWIEPLRYSKCFNNIITIVVPNNHSQMLDYISKKYKVCFQSVISEMFENMYEIEFV